MSRIPIEQTVGFGVFYGPVGYFQDGNFEAPRDLVVDAPNILRPFYGGPTWSSGEDWCTVLIKATVSSDLHPEPEELSFWWFFNFVRTRMRGPFVPFFNNPFSHIYFFESGQSYQFNSTYGPGGSPHYSFVRPTFKVVGHRIPFKVYYTVATGLLSGGTISLGEEQVQRFSRTAGWEHDITAPEPEEGKFSYLTDVRIAPV